MTQTNTQVGMLPPGVFHEDLVVAVLHVAGQERFHEDSLMRVLDEAAKEHGGMFWGLKSNPGYKDSLKVREILSVLVCGGALSGSTDRYRYRCAKRTLGKYGEKKLQLFAPQAQEVIRAVGARFAALASQ